MAAQPDALGSLAKVVRLADPDSLAEDLDRLAGPLGLAPGDVAHLQELDATELARKLRAAVDHHRQARRRARAGQAEERAGAAALQLVRTAKWNGTAVHLDPALVLGGLAYHPTAKLVAFEVEGEIVYVPVRKLRQARQVLRGFDDLRVYVVHPELRIRWRGGVGGLNLRCPAPSPHNRDQVLIVRLQRPAEVQSVEEVAQARHEVSRRHRRPQRAGKWLGEILDDIGLLS